ncbi:MAG TPA: hypothetical protein VN519_06355 [Bryobacteraceae bacterium]|nr:hypothetical protein [Bryobacteraceae bacterium]
MNKNDAAALAPAGWSYCGFDDPYYLFQMETRDALNLPRYRAMLLLEEDMTERNIEFMVRHNLTRVEGFSVD